MIKLYVLSELMLVVVKSFVDPDADDNMNQSPLTFSTDLVVKITDVEVTIDIHPGTNPNSINPNSAGVIPGGDSHYCYL